MKYRESISEPPLDKLEQIRQKFSKQLTKVKAKGFVTCSIGKSIQNDDAGSRISLGKSSFLEKLQSINSFEDDERTLLKSIQFDVQLAIKRYQKRIEQITQQQVERSSLRSCQQEIVQYLTTPQQDNKYIQLDSQILTKRSASKSTIQITQTDTNHKELKQCNKNILGNKKSNKTFKIISDKQNKFKQTKKQSNQSLTEISLLNKKQSLNKDGALSQKSVSTRQPSVKEIAINLEQRRSTGMSQRNKPRQSRNSINSFENKQQVKTKKPLVF
ncbi:unnamed protein product [Paramecium sonneborni]|uniref:Uncharacterized protein n=1 Tax=Paramecium sonneborni TaxID=65129 RepID=A0A8S1L3U6_9CILI|nr:unnamed protein product [Paramecium sonneborni]